MRIVWLDFDDSEQAARLLPLMHGLEARIVCPRASRLARALREHGQDGDLTAFRGGYKAFLWLLALRRLLADKPDTVLLAHGDSAVLAAGWLRHVAPKIPLVVFFSDSTARPAAQWSRGMVRNLARADQVCVVTHELAASLTERLSELAPNGEIRTGRVRVVPPLASEMGVLFGDFAGALSGDASTGVSSQELNGGGATRRTVFLSADDLVPESGFHDLMDAMGLLQGLENLPPWEVRVLGEGPEFDALLDKARDLKTEGPLALLGLQPLDAQLPLAHVAVNTTRTSRNRMEFIFRSWAHGRALVCSATPEALELVSDKVNGFLYPPGNAVALAALLARCLSDPDMLRQLATAGRESLAGYSAEMVAGYLQAACRDVRKKD